MCSRSRRSEKMPTVAISRPSSSSTSAAEIETGTCSPAAASRWRRTGSSRPPPPCSAERMSRMTSLGDARRVELLHRHAPDDVARLVAADALRALVEEQDRARACSAAMIPSTVEFRMRFRNSLVRRSSRSSSRARVTSRNEKIAVLVLGEDADRRDRDGDAIARGRDQLEIEVVDGLASDGARRSDVPASAGTARATNCMSGLPARPSRA